MGSFKLKYCNLTIIGGFYQPDGSEENWWSDTTEENYVGARKCMEQYYGNQTAGPYELPGVDDPISVCTIKYR